jgi:hypothetical protein
MTTPEKKFAHGAGGAARGRRTHGRPFNIRFPTELLDRLGECARDLGLDVSSLVRLMLNEQLPLYEERAGQARRTRDQSKASREQAG